MKLVGADSGHYEHEEFVDEVLLAPSERVVIDVLLGDRASSPSSTTRPTVPIDSPGSPSRTSGRTRVSRPVRSPSDEP